MPRHPLAAFKRRRLMSVYRKLLLTSLILLVGLAAAWPFRLGPGPLSEQSESLVQAPPVPKRTMNSSTPTPEHGAFDLQDHPALQESVSQPTSDLSRAARYEARRVPASSVVDRTVERPPLPPSVESALENSPTTAGAHSWPKQRNHIVHNGDTLEKLAERYLGDPLRALEIFDLNRDQLANPHLLPIGAELRIPPAEAGSL